MCTATPKLINPLAGSLNRFNCTLTLHNWCQIPPLNHKSKCFTVHLRHFSWNFHPCRQCKHVYRSTWISRKAQKRNWSASRFPLSSEFFCCSFLFMLSQLRLMNILCFSQLSRMINYFSFFLCNFESRHVIATLINNFIFTKYVEGFDEIKQGNKTKA